MTLTLPVITSSTLASHSAEYDIPITQYRLKYDIIHSKSHESISSVDSLDRQLYPGGYAKFQFYRGYDIFKYLFKHGGVK